MDKGVIERKLRLPPLSEQLVARPRLDGLLAMLVEHYPLVFVCATAGAGKTTAVVQATKAQPRPVAWLTVDTTEVAPGRFLTYLEAALARTFPSVTGVATRALAQRLPQREAAGLLAEAIADEGPLLLVIDELERLADARDALDLLAAFLRYAPPTLRVVLVSRVELALDLGSGFALGKAAAVGEEALAFTTGEAADALALHGRDEIDPSDAVEATGGWVTGVLFEAWRSAEHVTGLGGEADPLYGYLSTQILEQLDPDDRDFLIATSLLDVVTADRAEALHQPAARERLVRLRRGHLPVAWDSDAETMRCHTRFREYLYECLLRRGHDEVNHLRLAYANRLVAEGHHEDAVEQFLAVKARSEALTAAEHAIEGVIERLDLDVAERWLAELTGVADGAPQELTLTLAELMLALGHEDYARGVRVGDRLGQAGHRDQIARASSRAASMMAWCYWHLERDDDVRELIEAADPSPDLEATRYLLHLVDTTDDRLDPALSGGPLDALVMRVHYAHGRLGRFAEESPSRWASAISAPWQVGVLRATGHAEEALALYRSSSGIQWSAAWLHGIVAPEVFTDLGQIDEARAAVAAGRQPIARSGSLVFVMLNMLIAAKLELRLARDPDAALAILDELEERPAARRYGFIAEQLDTWTGYALLLKGDTDTAARHLRAAVDSMLTSDRIIELPAAAVYLSECEWRLDNEDAADAAARLAVTAAERQGSNHLLLQALADFPAIVARGIDSEARADSVWHELGRALMTQDAPVEQRGKADVVLREFGRKALIVAGEEVRPRIAKTYELAAYLATTNGDNADRDELLDVLFDGRVDPSARSYLRQVLHRLREVLPDDIELSVNDGVVHLDERVRLRSESVHFESRLAEAARLRGRERLAATRKALELVERGEYLPGARSAWVDARRDHLAELSLTARLEAAELAFTIGDYPEAERLVGAVLGADAFREAGWRLQMRLAGAVGDEDRVIAAYRRCESALAEIGTSPSTTTRDLLTALRH